MITHYHNWTTIGTEPILQSISRAFACDDSVLPFSDSQEDLCERPNGRGLSFVAWKPQATLGIPTLGHQQPSH